MPNAPFLSLIERAGLVDLSLLRRQKDWTAEHRHRIATTRTWRWARPKAVTKPRTRSMASMEWRKVMWTTCLTDRRRSSVTDILTLKIELLNQLPRVRISL